MAEYQIPLEITIISFQEMLELVSTGSLVVGTREFTGKNLVPSTFFGGEFQMATDGSKLLVGSTSWPEHMKICVNGVCLIAETRSGEFPDDDQLRRFACGIWSKMAERESLPPALLILTDEQAKIMKLSGHLTGEDHLPVPEITSGIVDMMSQALPQLSAKFSGADLVLNPSGAVKTVLLDPLCLQSADVVIPPGFSFVRGSLQEADTADPDGTVTNT